MKADDEEKVPVAEYHPFKRHFFIFRMASRAWLEVKPEAAAALEKIIGESVSQGRLIDFGLLMTIDSELPHRGKAQTPSKDPRQT